jgi:DDE superfamily endonuclease
MTTPQSPLAHFRAECYQTFGRRRDSLCDLLDAVLTSERVSSLVRLSLAPVFRRGWPSLFDALTDGRLDLAALRRLWVRTLPAPPPDQRVLWALDGSTWPRPEAKTSPERTCCRFVTAGIPESGIMPGWEYQWLVAIPEAQGSWVLPLDIRRRSLAAGTPTQLALAQLRDVLATYTGARPVVVMDSHYDVPALVRAGLALDLLARLACNRRFYRAPPPYAGTGRPRKHGPVFRLGDPATQHDPDHVQTWPDPAYGQVTLTLWTDLHTQPAPDVQITVLRVEVAHLPRRDTPPAPLWLAWHGTTVPSDQRALWHAYQRRFTVEHAFRFGKQELGWTTPRLRWPAAADQWSWLVGIVLWELWLARPLVADARLPWEHVPVAGAHLSPGRVRRGMAGLLVSLGSPARAPQPRGKAPGRPVGERPGRARRYPTQRRAPPPAG